MTTRDFDAVLERFREKAALRIAEFEATLEKSHGQLMKEPSRPRFQAMGDTRASQSTWGTARAPQQRGVRTVLKRGL